MLNYLKALPWLICVLYTTAYGIRERKDANTATQTERTAPTSKVSPGSNWNEPSPSGNDTNAVTGKGR